MTLLRNQLNLIGRLAFASLFLTTFAWAQFDTATVLGTVRDSSKLPIHSSIVTLTNVATGVAQSATTNEIGDYQFFNVKIGRYTVSAEAAGFKKVSAEEFTVTVNARQRVDLDLPIGTVNEVVNVSAAAAQLETDSSSRGTVVSSQQIINLPLNGRSYADLALLVPGVRKSDLAYGGTPRDASFNVNGMRSSQNNFVLDGVDNNAYGTSNQGFSNQVTQISPDAVQEFRVETSSYSAEFGRAGGAIINASVRLRRQPVPRHSLRIPPQHATQRGRLLQARSEHQARPHPEPVRSHLRRPCEARQELLLRRLRRPAPHRSRHPVRLHPHA